MEEGETIVGEARAARLCGLSAPEKGDVQRSSRRYLYRGLLESFVEYKLADGESKTPCGREGKIIKKHTHYSITVK